MLRFSFLARLSGLVALAASAVSGYCQVVDSDNGDGTYTNPVIRADYPDCDLVRVGKDFYMVSSDFHNVPGDPILHSTDLVNWQIIGHAIPAYDSDARYNLEGGDRYGFGSWAPSIRYHDGMFYVLYNTNDHGAYVSRASDPAGPWKVNALGITLYDPGLFFNDDGRVWVVSGQSTLSLTELDSDLRGVKTPSRSIYSGNHYDEGSHVYKRNGYYYILTATTRIDLPTRFALQVERSRSLSGPYKTRIIFTDDGNWSGWALHQGGFVETAQGEWWAMLFQDRADFGREPTLQPVHWVDDWPVVGVQGRAVITYRKPDVGLNEPPLRRLGPDDFDGPRLGLQWEWNHNPDSGKWSLKERPGFLRLKTASVTNSLRSARNTLGQRLVEGGPVTVTTKLDVSGMRMGDVAGLAMFQIGDSSIAIIDEGEKKIAVRDGDRNIATAIEPVRRTSVWLRLETSATRAEVRYLYSLDGRHFIALGEAQPLELHMLGYWVGQRISLFNYATQELGGYVDVDFFQYATPEHKNLFAAQSIIEASRYDEIENGHAQWIGDPFETERNRDKRTRSYERAVGPFEQGGWLKFNRIDFGRGKNGMEVNAASRRGEWISVRADSRDGPLLGSCRIVPRGDASGFSWQHCRIRTIDGQHTIFLVFNHAGDQAFRIKSFRFSDCRRDTRHCTAAGPSRQPKQQVTQVTPFIH